MLVYNAFRVQKNKPVLVQFNFYLSFTSIFNFDSFSRRTEILHQFQTDSETGFKNFNPSLVCGNICYLFI